MGPIAASLGVAALGVAALNLATNRHGRHPDAVGASLALLGTWAIAMFSNAWLSPPESKLLNPVIDLSLALWITWAWSTRPRVWKLLLLGLLVLQSLSHVAFWVEPRAPGVLMRYSAGLDFTFFAELLVASWPGGERAWIWAVRALRPGSHSGRQVGAR